MSYKIDFGTYEEAEEFSRAIDKAYGLPVAGTKIGRGRHVPDEIGMTTRLYTPVETGERTWEYPILTKHYDGLAVEVNGSTYIIDMTRAVLTGPKGAKK